MYNLAQRNKFKIVKGSLEEIRRQSGSELAAVFFTQVEMIVVFDVSSSMSVALPRRGMRRIDAAEAELFALQERYPGKIALVDFNSSVQFRPNGTPRAPKGTTNLTGALKFVHIADRTGIKIVVISDGRPDNKTSALKIARKFDTRIDVIYIGEEGGSGQKFLEKLAKSTGGQYYKPKEVKLLGAPITALLESKEVIDR